MEMGMRKDAAAVTGQGRIDIVKLAAVTAVLVGSWAIVYAAVRLFFLS
jgi:hypothetical protein